MSKVWCLSLVATQFQLVNLAGAYKVDDDTLEMAVMESFFDDTHPIENWDTSKVTNMNGVFRTKSSFNKDISKWNTARVTDMSDMFNGARKFNKDLGKWDTAMVTSMKGMFLQAYDFNGDLGNWNTHKVTSMASMFLSSGFNQDISEWDTARVTDMSRMFSRAASFNQDLGKWNTASVSSMLEMFKGAASFNGPIGNWNTAKVVSMIRMFSGASLFDQDLSGWSVSQVGVGGLLEMFCGSTVACGPLPWSEGGCDTDGGDPAPVDCGSQPPGTTGFAALGGTTTFSAAEVTTSLPPGTTGIAAQGGTTALSAAIVPPFTSLVISAAREAEVTTSLPPGTTGLAAQGGTTALSAAMVPPFTSLVISAAREDTTRPGGGETSNLADPAYTKSATAPSVPGRDITPNKTDNAKMENITTMVLPSNSTECEHDGDPEITNYAYFIIGITAASCGSFILFAGLAFLAWQKAMMVEYNPPDV